MEMSGGHQHALGEAYSIILDHEYYFYTSVGQVNEEVYSKLNSIYNIDWTFYDKWKRYPNGSFSYERDNYIDMIFMIHRSRTNNNIFVPGGVAALCGLNGGCYEDACADVLVDPVNNEWVAGNHENSDRIGSGLYLTPGHSNGTPLPPLELRGVLSFSAHELGHYLFGCGHSGYGLMTGVGAVGPGDNGLSPWERLRMGYFTSKQFTYGQEVTIGDFYRTGEVLAVPVLNSGFQNEKFYICNRRKISYYDRVMWGDSALGSAYNNEGNYDFNYGKGLYIYHVGDAEIYGGTNIDMECADGLWDYSFVDCLPLWGWNMPHIEPYFPDNQNDDPSTSGLTAKDGASVLIPPFTCPGNGTWHCKWLGTYKEWTNYPFVWPTRENWIDRYDAFKTGYNEIFSNWSNPGSQNKLDASSNILIYYYQQDGDNNAHLKIYQTGQGYTEDQILALTPPSKPMLYKIEAVECNGTYAYSKITWENNKEPDMLRDGGFKRYKIYRAKSFDMETIPVTYYYQETYDDYTPYDTASYIDRHQALIHCDGGTHPEDYINFRYKVMAVDKDNTQSVMSDFQSTNAPNLKYEDRLSNLNNKPANFSLSNYPNPFNPTTMIKFGIPKDVLVKITVYDLLGREINTLINEFKTAGFYEVRFDGTNLASGLYFYKIEAGSYIQTKRMLLLK
jgi:hypothetical protein